MRIALIHALAHSLAPIEDAFARLWPEIHRTNLLDDSLSADLARDGALTPAMTGRFLALARYAAGTGADAILFTCSAFGPCIEACAAALAPNAGDDSESRVDRLRLAEILLGPEKALQMLMEAEKPAKG